MHSKTSLFAAATSLAASLLLTLALVPAAMAAATSETRTATPLDSAGQACSSAWIDDTESYAEFNFEAPSWTGTFSTTDVSVASDSNANGGAWAYLDSYWSPNGFYEDEPESPSIPHIVVTAYGKGTHSIVVRQTFYNAKRQAVHHTNYTLTVSLLRVGISKRNIVSYKNKKTTLKTEYLAGTITWKSTNSKIASVSSKGVVKGKKLGRCTVEATGISGRTGETVTVSCLVEVTYKKAYKAVQNAWKDYRNTKLKYSQNKRMKKNYRDCSSFVSRCYWDSSLKRKNLVIGGKDARYWSYTAAEQARWLNSHKKKVAKKAVSLSKLLPGDTIYYETDYAGRNDEYRHIDHAAIYVGGGVVLNTSSRGPYGCIGNRGYYSSDKSIKFIGRPCK